MVFVFVLDVEVCVVIVGELVLFSLFVLCFIGDICFVVYDVWEVMGLLIVKVVQFCVVMLVLVKIVLIEKLCCVFLFYVGIFEGDEVEMCDEEFELFGQFIDL